MYRKQSLVQKLHYEKNEKKKVLSIAGYQKKKLRLFGRLIPSVLYSLLGQFFPLGKRTSLHTLL